MVFLILVSILLTAEDRVHKAQMMAVTTHMVFHFFHIQIVHSANIHPVPAVQGNNATDPTSGTVAQPTRTSRQKKRCR
jgi:hypothetical protein